VSTQFQDETPASVRSGVVGQTAPVAATKEGHSRGSWTEHSNTVTADHSSKSAAPCPSGPRRIGIVFGVCAFVEDGAVQSLVVVDDAAFV
jgi:hypothetical protein